MNKIRKTSLPGHIRQMLSPPAFVVGSHFVAWLLDTAKRLHDESLSPNIVFALLHNVVQENRENVDDIQLAEIVCLSSPVPINSDAAIGSPTDEETTTPFSWPEKNHERILEIASRGFTVSELAIRSSLGPRYELRCTEEIIDALFPGNPLLCCGDLSNVEVKSREEWRGGMGQLPFLVPNPMKGNCGISSSGRITARCNSNVAGRNYLVVEPRFQPIDSDGNPSDDIHLLSVLGDRGIRREDLHAGIIWELSKSLPLVLVVRTFRPSLQAWFATAGRQEAELLAFMKTATSLGADPFGWIKCSLAFTPDRIDARGNRQWVSFFQPPPVAQYPPDGWQTVAPL